MVYKSCISKMSWIRKIRYFKWSKPRLFFGCFSKHNNNPNVKMLMNFVCCYWSTWCCTIAWHFIPAWTVSL